MNCASCKQAIFLTTLLLALAGVFLFAGRPTAVTANTPAAVVTRAWELARGSSVYAFDSDVTVTTYPLPSLSNTGRQPEVDRLAASGEVDRQAETMSFTLWNGAPGQPEDGLQVRVEDGQTYQRQGAGGWEQTQSLGDLFAPGGDPFIFLEGAENVQYQGVDTRMVGDVTLQFTVYTFDLYGPHYAELMRQELQAQLAETGKLPPGVKIETPKRYLTMQGTGELWLDEEGLPARLAVEMDFPQHEDEAHFLSAITLDFRSFDRSHMESGTFSLPHNLVNWIVDHGTDVATKAAGTLPATAVILLIMGFYWFQSRRAYTIVIFLCLITMLLTPLLQSQAVAAFYEDVAQESSGRQVEQEAEQAKADALQKSLTSDWDPHQGPGQQLGMAQAPNGLQTDASPAQSPLLVSLQTTPDTTDTDGDGLLDTDEAFWESCDGNGGEFCLNVADPTDSDGDGLSDGVEVNELGTDPAFADSDADGINDSEEVRGFSYNGQMWYFNPREADTNKDGIPDGNECEVLVAGSPNFNANGVCPDTDNDGIPDPFDNDNDGDRVPDRYDLSPFAAASGPFDRDNPLGLRIDNLTVDKPVFVDIQFRPTDAGNLYLKDHVLDWPAGDTQGQFQRTLTTTFATTTNPEAVAHDARAANGDVRLIPMLQIMMPGQSGHYANLPITTTAPAVREDGVPVTDWLDENQLEPFGIHIQDDDSAGENGLAATIPLIPVVDQQSGTVAFQARMLYRPGQGSNDLANWGPDHELRVIWLVQMLTDECIDPNEDPATCERQDVVKVVHVYDETWELTGMTISEQHGMDIAVLYEDPALDPDANYEEQLTQVAHNLSNTFMRARDCDTLVNGVCSSDDTRDVTVANLDTTLASDDWLGADSYVAVHDGYHYEHQAYLGKFANEAILPILESEWGVSPAGDPAPLILSVREITARSLDLQEITTPAAGDTAVFDASLNPVTMTGSMSWTPYRHDGSEWVAYNQQDYLENLALRLPAANDFFQPVDNGLSAQQEAEGKIILAQYFYAALLSGYASLLEVDGVTAFATNPEIPEAAYEPFFAVGSLTGFTTILMAIAETYIRAIDSLSFFQDLRSLYEIFTQSKTLSQLPTAFQMFKTAYAKVANALLGAILLIAVAAVALYIYAVFAGDATALRIAEIVLGVVTIIMVLVQLMIMIYLVVQLAQTAAVTFTAVYTIMQSTSAIGGLGVLIGAVLAWGYVAYWAMTNSGASTIEQNVVISIAIAITIWLVFLLILNLFGLGPLILLMFLVDAIFLIMGKKGPSTYVIEWLASLIYDVDMLLTNLDSEGRLQTDIAYWAFTDPAAGFVSSNELGVSFAVTNTVRYKQAFNTDQAMNRSVFEYYLHDAPPADPYHQGLQRGDSFDDWVNLGGREIQMITETETVTVTLASVGTGINQGLPLILTEAMMVSWRGCWGALTNTNCSWDQKRQSVPIDLSESLTFDILPDTVAEFAALNWNADGALAFPPQRDLDGDGLSGLDGTDPNDRLVDTDGDGLTDFYELNNGLDPELADMDGDGLTDGEELRLGTNPTLADTDGDRLNDRIEAVEGWLISYDGGVTRVWSDPFSPDSDGDGLDDLQEYVFGFHPLVATDPSRAREVVQFDYLQVSEQSAPFTLLPFDQTTGSLFLQDSSGMGNHAACDADTHTCPLAGVSGREGYGLQFDGVDDEMTLDGAEQIEIATGNWSIGTWVKVTGGSNHLFTIHDNDGVWEVEEPRLEISGDTVVFDYSQGTTGNVVTYIDGTAPGLSDGTWHHVMVTYDYDETTNSADSTIYVDGIDVTGSEFSNEPLPASMTAHTFTLGAGPAMSHGRFAGQIDDFVIYEYALSPAEVANVMNGVYNLDDLFVTPGAGLTYQTLVTNTTASTGINGFLTAQSDILDPEIARPVAALNFEPDQYIRTFANGNGESSSATCVADGTCPTLEVPGALNTAVTFDAIDDHIDMPVLAADPDGLLVAWWMKLDSLPSTGERAYILDSQSDFTDDLDIYVADDGYLWIDFGGTAVHRSSFNFNGNTGTWVHMAFWIVAGRSGNDATILAVNGSEDSDNFALAEWPTEIMFGSGPAGVGFEGSLDEFVVYDEPDYTAAYDDSHAFANNFSAIEKIEAGNYTADYCLDFDPNGINCYVEDQLAPVVLYTLDDGAGHDGLTFGNRAHTKAPLTCDSAATCPAVVDGYSGEAVSFDGVDDYLPLNQTFSMMGSAMFLDMWLNVASAPSGDDYIIDGSGSGGPTPETFQLWIDGGMNLHFEPFGVVASASGGPGDWIHVQIDGGDVRINGQLRGGCGNCLVTFEGGRLGDAADRPGFFAGAIDGLVIENSSPGLNGDYYDIPFDLPSFTIGLLDSTTKARGAHCRNACPELDEAGALGSAMAFDGVDDTLMLDPIDFAQGDYTISLWFNATTTTIGQTLLAAFYPGSSQPRVMLELDTAGRIRFLNDFEVAGEAIVTGASYDDNQWHHVAAIHAGEDLLLYVDGVLAGSGTTGDQATGPLDITLGVLGANNTLYLDGMLDEVTIFPAAVTAEGVQLLQSSTFPTIDIPDDFVAFAAGPLSSSLIEGSASVDETAVSSIHQIDLEAEAALDISDGITYPIFDPYISDLVHFLPFEEAPGALLFDDAIQNVDPVCQAPHCPLSGLRGAAMRAAYFDGVDDVLELDAGPLNGEEMPSFTVATWVKAERGTILDMRYEQPGGITTGAQWDFNRFQVVGYGDTLDVPLTLRENEWVHVAVVQSWVAPPCGGYTYCLDVDVYINGQLATSASIGTEDQLNFWSQLPPVIGRNKNGLDPLLGALDDLRLYYRVFSAADVADLYRTSVPVLQLEFEEGDEATAFVDSSRNGIVGLPTTLTTFDENLNETITTLSPAPGMRGFIGSGAFFDGTGWIELQEAQDVFSQMNDFTVMAWIRPEESDRSQTLLASGNNATANDGYDFSVADDGSLRFTNWSNNQNFLSTSPIRAGVWQHVAVVFDDSNDVHFYIDGELINTVAGNTAVNPETGDPLFIGAIQSVSGAYLNRFFGDIDELVVYHRGLNNSEINSVYLRQFRFYRATASTLVRVDTEAPTVELLSDAGYYQNGYIQLGVSATDVESPIQRVDFQLKQNDVVVQDWQRANLCVEAIESSAAWCPSFDTTQLEGEGVYTIQFRAFDAVGHEGVSLVYTLNVDGSAPQVDGTFDGNWAQLTSIGDLKWSLPLNGTISDPDIAAGVSGSGVYTPTVTVALVNNKNEVAGTGPQLASVSGNTWSLDYIFHGLAPQGEYRLVVTAEDRLGNQTVTTLAAGNAAVKLDARPAHVEFDDWTAGNVISQSTTLNGLALELPAWGSNLARYHFEVAEPFNDHSENGNHATCTNCPAAAAGLFGDALLFDGLDDTVDVPNLFNPITDTFSISLWFWADGSGSGQRLLVQQDNGSGQGRSLLFLTGDNRLASFLGTVATVSSNVVATDAWHHATLTFNGNTIQLYLDGLLVAENGVAAEAADGGLQLGSNRGSSAFFPGMLDEVAFYGRVLTPEEIYALAQSESAGINSVEIWLHEETFTDEESVPEWQAAMLGTSGSPLSTWEYTLPTGLENYYNVILRTTDAFANISNERTVWRGQIDLVAPRINDLSVTHSGGGSAATSLYTYSVTDLAIDIDSMTALCPANTISFTQHLTTTAVTDLAATCRIPGHTTETVSLNVCDEAGRCTTDSVTPLPSPQVASVAILTPTYNAIISDIQSGVPIGGGAFDPNGIETIDVLIDDALFDTVIVSGWVTDTTWTVANWQPLQHGTFTLTAVMTNSLGTAVSDTVTVTIDDGAVIVPIAAADSYTVTEDVIFTQAAPGVLANDSVGGGDGLTAVLDSDVNNGTLDLASSGAFTYTSATNFCGTDAFSYSADDGVAASTPATVTLTVTCVNDWPLAADDTFTVVEDSTDNVLDVLSNDSDVDGDILTIDNVTPPANGSIVNNGDDVTYTPNSGFSGSDSFIYTISDGQGGSDTATVTVLVNMVNSAPTAHAGGPYTVYEGGSVLLDASATTDEEQDPATLTYAWDLDGDGVYDDAVGITTTFSALALSGPMTVTVGLQVTDDGGLVGVDTAVVTILNRPPTIHIIYLPLILGETDTTVVGGTAQPFTPVGRNGRFPWLVDPPSRETIGALRQVRGLDEVVETIYPAG